MSLAIGGVLQEALEGALERGGVVVTEIIEAEDVVAIMLEGEGDMGADKDSKVDDEDGEVGKGGATSKLGNALLLVGVTPKVADGATIRGS